MGNLTVKIISQENNILNINNVLCISLPVKIGSITILPKHVNLITKLYNGKILLRTLNDIQHINIYSGIANVYHNKIWILLLNKNQAEL
ncbi:MAG: hypothetical protein LBM05_01960 [Endomicrobium sp.]|jgi:F0F1-type ATP synthase epsilon subunit|nr:hypothetical protein [Endomicrobium sp.]